MGLGHRFKSDSRPFNALDGVSAYRGGLISHRKSIGGHPHKGVESIILEASS